MKIFYTGLIFAAIIAGCSQESSAEKPIAASLSSEADHPYCGGSFRIESGFTSTQRDDINIATARMNKWLGYDYFVISENGKCPIFLGELEDPNAAAMCNCSSDQYNSGITIQMSRLQWSNRTSGTRFQTVIMHEMGHSLGMLHVEDPKNTRNFAVMGSSNQTISEDLTARDWVECMRAGFCMR